MQPDRYIRSLYVYGVTVDPNTSVRFITSLFVCTKNASHLGISISPLKCVSATSCARPLRVGPRSAPGVVRLTARNLFEAGALPPHPPAQPELSRVPEGEIARVRGSPGQPSFRLRTVRVTTDGAVLDHTVQQRCFH